MKHLQAAILDHKPSTTQPSRPQPDHPQPDGLSNLPPELLLMITSHFTPQTSDTTPAYLFTPYGQVPDEEAHHAFFVSHPSLLALSRTCKNLHVILTPELIKSLLAAEDGDPLRFAFRRPHLGLAVKLLEERWVQPTEEKLLFWVWRHPSGTENLNKKREVRREIVRILARLGVGRALGKEWHAMMGLRWPGR